jgi:hypothetical protein
MSTSVKLPKESILKATTVVFSNEVCSTCTAMSSRTLLSDHVNISNQNLGFAIMSTLRFPVSVNVITQTYSLHFQRI